MTEARSGFSDVDASTDPASLVRFLDERSRSSFFAGNRQARLAALRLTPGDRVLEVGSGAGDFTRDLRAAAGPGGTVVGLDFSALMAATAHARSSDAAAAPDYCVGDACNAPLADESFDAVTAERVLFHLAEPQRAVAEIVRVARPGARIAVFDPDWETMTIAGADDTITSKIIAMYVGRLASPWAAARLAEMFGDAGLTSIDVTSSAHVVTQPGQSGRSGVATTAERAVRDGNLTSDELTAWRASVRAAAAAGTYAFSVTFLLVSARKP